MNVIAVNGPALPDILPKPVAGGGMDMMTWLMVSMIIGSIGVGYFVYGKRQQMLMPMLAGAAMVIYPCFLNSLLLTILIAILVMALPFFLRF